MKRYNVNFEIKVPKDVPFEDVREWVEFECHANSSMKGTNLLCDADIEPRWGSCKVTEVP